MTLPRAGAGRGVSPLARLSQTTAPPGPGAPPPATVPLTATVAGREDGDGGTTSGAEGGAGDPAGGDGGSAAAGCPPARAGADTASGRVTGSISGSSQGRRSRLSHLAAAAAKSPASQATLPPASRLKIR